MYPRGSIDIRFSTLARAFWYSVQNFGALKRSQSPLTLRDKERDAMICLSVRSGFDLVLQSLNFPAGSEIIMSAITIPDMVRIVQSHGLVPVPLEVDLTTLSYANEQVEMALSSKTRAIVIAHLFGSRMNMEHIHSIARASNLVVIEDCAQAFDGTDYRGDKRSDFTMFSFGMIKTATSLGGAIVHTSNRRALIRMLESQSTYPTQNTLAWVRKLINALTLKVAAIPTVLGMLNWLCRKRQVELDSLILSRTQGFTGEFHIERFRMQPCNALKRLLKYRLRENHFNRIEQRKKYAVAVNASIERSGRIGTNALMHSHWVCPMTTENPRELISKLTQQGFDATQRSSRLVHIEEMLDENANRTDRTIDIEGANRKSDISTLSWMTSEAMSHLVYIPIYPQMAPADRIRMCELITEHQKRNSRHATSDISAEHATPSGRDQLEASISNDET